MFLRVGCSWLPGTSNGIGMLSCRWWSVPFKCKPARRCWQEWPKQKPQDLKDWWRLMTYGVMRLLVRHVAHMELRMSLLYDSSLQNDERNSEKSERVETKLSLRQQRNMKQLERSTSPCLRCILPNCLYITLMPWSVHKNDTSAPKKKSEKVFLKPE